MIAADDLTHEQIAQQVGITRKTLWSWRQGAEFQKCVEGHQAIRLAAVRNRGIAVLEHRIDALDRRWRLMEQVIRARAADETMTEAGHETGLLVRTYKVVGSGEGARTVEEYQVDVGLLKEMREHEKQAAIELGQWQADETSLDLGSGKLTIKGITFIEPKSADAS